MHSIRTKISSVTISAIIITMLIAAIFGVVAIRNIGMSSSEQVLRLLCESGQKNLDSALQYVEQNVQTISAYVESDLHGLDDEELQDHLDHVSDFFKKVMSRTNGIKTYYYRIDPNVSSNVPGFWFVNANGEGFEEHEVTDITRYDTEDTTRLVWFTVPKATGEPVWLPPYITENLDARVISYNTPVYFNEQFVGVIGIELDYSFMAEEIDNIKLYENGYAFVTDEEGKLIYHPKKDIAVLGVPLEGPEGLAGDNEIVHYQYEGVDKIGISLPLCNGDRLCVSVPIQEINAGWQRWVIMIIIVFAVLLILFIIFILRFTGRITKPLQDLTKVAEQIDQGDYDCKPDYDGDDEIGVLTRTFSRVTANLKEYITDLNDLTGQLTQQKESLSALLDHMPGLNFSKDAETGVYLYCNQGFADYANKPTPADVVGLTDYQMFDAETANYFEEDDQKALSMNAPHKLFEKVPDALGNPRRFQTTKMKFYDASGRLCLLGMCVDITELERLRKESDKTKAAYEQVLSASAVYEDLIDALSQDFFALYYVDVETDAYVEYSAGKEEGRRLTEKHGTGFFAENGKEAGKDVFEEDRERYLSALDKAHLLGEIDKHGVYVFYYRLMIDEAPTYVRMKVTRAPEDERHIILGFSNVDSQVKDRMAAERAVEERKSYLRLSALSGNLIALYYVDPETEAYTLFSSSGTHEGLGIATEGTDFFLNMYEKSLSLVHPEDRPLFRSQVTKKNILSVIERDGMFVLAFRLMNGDRPMYVRLKAAKVEEDGNTLLLVGLLDEDVQIRQEQEYARDLSVAKKMATVDSLTGVKNKHAYAQWEEKIDAKIKKGEQEPFAVVVCDINNLKAVNDLYGHKEGDTCIQKACKKICTVFDHSPVFRTGGDEFVVLLSGGDYERRMTLMEEINALPIDRTKIRIGETISAGMVEFNKNRHFSLLSVLEEADKAMYERKMFLKENIMSGTQEDDSEEVKDLEETASTMHVRKRLLIADDVETNREILGDLLGDEYDLLYAADGVETLEVLRSHKDEIDLLLLDLQMPNKNGREVITEMQVDEELMSIPVIILTVDQSAELDCLRIGAMDFIPKPFPDIDIVKARIAKCIELSEDRELIRHTERDRLTGLLNKDHFLRYVARLDQIYMGTTLDALAFDVNRFHSVNKHYGRQFGDLVLQRIGICLRSLAREVGGVSCREGGDTFLLYCPHREDIDTRLRAFKKNVFSDQEIENRVTLRIGVFADAQLVADAEDRFVRAKVAAEKVKEDPEALCGFYDLT